VETVDELETERDEQRDREENLVRERKFRERVPER
jgi:hypothetical protein